jgi:hypothetical protein
VRANWWKPVRVKIIRNAVREIGRPRKYMINLLNVGQSMIFPWDEITDVLSFKQCVQSYSRRSQRKFKTDNVGIGIKVSRIM